jgi:hypothetical protein
MKQYIGDLKKQQVLTTLYLNFNDQDQILWENESEFIYKDNLYDLIEKKHFKEGIIITCLADKNEESLIKSFNNFNDQSDPSHTCSISLFKLINQTFLSTENIKLNKIENSKALLTSHHRTDLLSQIRLILTPPPEKVS